MKTFFELIFILLSFSLAGQNLTFSHLTIDQGLSNSTVYAIAEDKDGFIWLGTRDGLNKFDGYQFITFKADPHDSLSLPGNNIQTLFLDPDGDLWIGLRGGLCVFDRATQRFRPNPFAGKVYPDWGMISVQAIFIDSKGYMWMGTANHGVVRISPDEEGFEVFHVENEDPKRRLYDNACFSFVEDAQGNVWMGSAGLQIHCYLRAKDSIEVVQGQQEMGFDRYSYQKSLMYKDSLLWIGTEGDGLVFYDPERKAFKQKVDLGNNLIKDVVPYGEMVLVSTDGAGLFYTEDKGASFKSVRYTSNLLNSLNTDALYDIFIDTNDNVWIGSFNGGANIFAPNKAEFLTYAQEPKFGDAPGSQSVLAFFEDREGYIWIGKDGGGLVRFNPKDQSYRRFRADPSNPNSLSSNVITSLYEDSRGNIWAGTFSAGLNRFDPGTETFEIFRNDPSDHTSLANNNVWSILEDREGNLWIATLGEGLDRFDYATEQFFHFPADEQTPPRPGMLSGQNARVLLVDKEGDLWVGTEFGGLNKRDHETGAFENWRSDPEDPNSLQSNFILCLHQARDGRLWIGTEGGGLHLMKVNEASFENYTQNEGLPSDVINAIEEDENGTLWISTNNGLASFNPQTEEVSTFNKYDGLQSNQFNPAASLTTSEGEMYFGGVLGLNAFDPSRVVVNPSPAKLVFTDFMLFNESIPVGEKMGEALLPAPLNERPQVQLQHSDNVFTIEFAALDFTNAAKYEYAYRMKGFEESWTYVDAQHRGATYTNLDAGEYVFQVKAAQSNGPWSEEPIELGIKITPPFWHTTWFQLLASLVVLAIIALAWILLDVRRREAHQKEILEIKNVRLSGEVKEKNAQLSAALLQSAHKNDSLDQLKRQLLELTQENNSGGVRQKKEIRQLVRKIDSELSSEDYWEQFQLNFDQVHQAFSQSLYERHPNLTPNDIRLCCLMRINMTNREIASIMGISLSAVEKGKYRLKKKLELDKELDLNHYIHSIS